MRTTKLSTIIKVHAGLECPNTAETLISAKLCYEHISLFLYILYVFIISANLIFKMLVVILLTATKVIRKVINCTT